MNYILDTHAAETNRVFGKTNTFLLNSILALFHRSYLDSYDKAFIDITKETVSLINDPSLAYESSITRANQILTGVIHELCELQDKPTPDWLEARLKPLKVDHFEFVKMICSEFAEIETLPLERIKAKYLALRSLCDTYKEGYLVKSLAREMFGTVLNSDEHGAIPAMEMAMERILPLIQRKSARDPLNIPGISTFVSSSDKEAMVAEFKEAAELIDTRSVLKSGYQGWDKSLSDYGGLLRGSVIELQAISGGSKSDTARVFLTGVARHTKPFLLDETKKPCLIYLTLEDTISRSLSRTLTQVRREDQDRFDVEEVSEEESFEQYRELVESGGYTVFNIKGRQKELTPRNVLSLLEAIIDDGYEVHLMVMDYMGQLSFSDIDEANNSECIKTGYSYVFNFCQENKIAAILCAQIAGREYSEVIKSAADDGLKELVNKNISSQSMNIINVLDGRVMVHVVKGSSKAYHIWSSGKSRHGTSVLPADKYAVYEMHSAIDTRDGVMKPAGFIKPDHNDICRALKHVPQLGIDEDDEMVSF